MNITIDKPPTLQALQNAEATFLRFAVEARKLSREDIAKYWEQEARWITALREQIATHGKASNGEEKPN